MVWDFICSVFQSVRDSPCSYTTVNIIGIFYRKIWSAKDIHCNQNPFLYLCNKIVKNEILLLSLRDMHPLECYITLLNSQCVWDSKYFSMVIWIRWTRKSYLFLSITSLFFHFTEGIRFHPHSSMMAPEVCLEFSHYTISLSAAFLNYHNRNKT